MSDSIQNDYGAQAIDHNTLLDRLQYNVRSGCSVSPGSNDLTVQVASGEITHNGSTVSVSAQDNVSLTSADANNPRKDIVYLDSSGTLQVETGTAESPQPSGEVRRKTYNPTPPDLANVSGVVLAEVWVAAGASDISSQDVSDRRIMADAVFATLTADDVTASSSLTDPSGTTHNGKLADASDLHSRYTDEEAQDAVNALLAAGDKISLSYDDPNDTLTVDTSALDTEEVEDAVASLLTSTSDTTVSYDDANDELTIGLASSVSVDSFTASTSFTDPAGVEHTAELADASDVGSGSSVFEDSDGDGIYEQATGAGITTPSGQFTDAVQGPNYLQSESPTQRVGGVYHQHGGPTDAGGLYRVYGRRYHSDNVIQGHNSHVRPYGYEYQDTVYFTYCEPNGDDTSWIVYVTAFDQDLEQWRGEKTQITTITQDPHHTACVTVDANGYIYIACDYRNGSTGSEQIYKSDNPEDISSFTQVSSTTSGDYPQLEAINSNVYLVQREGSGSTRELLISETTDQGSTWSGTQLVSITDRWMYPGDTYWDGSRLHITAAARNGSSGDFTNAIYVAYDPTDGTLYGADGSTLSTPAGLTALQNAGSEITTLNAEFGGVRENPNNGNIVVAGAIPGDSGYDIAIYEYNSGWSQTATLANNYDTNGQFHGSRVLLENVNGNLRAYTILIDTLDYWELDDSNTWGSQQSLGSGGDILGAGVNDFAVIEDASGPMRVWGTAPNYSNAAAVDADLTTYLSYPVSRRFGRVVASGSVTLSSGSATIDTGVPSSRTATFTVHLGPATADADVAADIRADSGTGTYVVDIEETDTSVGNPSVECDIERVR